MAEPVELQLFPSCYSCLAWSADGELAVAAGEYVHILTPKITSRGAGTAQQSTTGKSSPWLFTRVRVNLFTTKEWEITWPQTRDHFSVGAEQSISTVAALAWSPPGLAKHRRCLLAVLTSNLVLSFYEPVGSQGKWTRVAMASNALREYFSLQPIADPGLKLRKKRIRAFVWCPPLKDQAAGTSDGAIFSSPETRWGQHLLAVANDDNDFIILRIKRQRGKAAASGSPYAIEALSHISIHQPVGNFPMISGGSLYAAAMRSRARVSHMSCGPWIRQPPPESRDVLSSSRAVIGVVYGSNLKLIDLDAITVSRDHAQQVRIADRAEFSVPDCKLEEVNFTGPLQWVFDEQSSSIALAAGIFAGRAILTLSEEVYTGKDIGNKGVAFWQRLFRDNTGDGGDGVSRNNYSRYWEPISAITAVTDKIGRPDTLHLSTVGSWAEVSPCSTLQEDGQGQGQILQPEWKKQVENFRERYDIDHDLGGLAVARTWGLAAFRGWIAAAFTMHPGDMVEYTTAAEERTTLVFSAAAPDTTDNQLFDTPNLTEEHFRKQRERVLEFILRHSSEKEDLWSNDLPSTKLIYAAAACSIVEHRNEELLSLARTALERLAVVSGADLSDEISKCFFSSSPLDFNVTIAAKSADKLNGPGGAIFEKCDICGSGIEWYSVQEAQCTTGHLFVRCALTFLAIQEPGISKFCSLCGTEFLDITNREEEATTDTANGAGNPITIGEKEPEEPVKDSLYLYDTVVEFFDTCPYCGGKFHDS
ncbi:hypothetical protein VTN77DRAFT_4720 [Rasamsonia byssochlamydoides]|uniref:uncharacterized protein n=1 Tax=Rasamsonia byssochlamydoides TaxID=89139 RepID=UPI0037420044